MNLADAKLLAEETVSGSEKAEFYGLKLSAPEERILNLAKCFLRLNDPVCCHAPVACEACPMTRWEIKATSWLNPLSKNGNGITNSPVIGRKGKPIVLNGRPYQSINAAARKLGVHKSTINRMLRDQIPDDTVKHSER